MTTMTTAQTTTRRRVLQGLLAALGIALAGVATLPASDAAASYGRTRLGSTSGG